VAEQCEEHKESAAKQTEMAVAATAASAAAVTQVNRANQQLLAEREAAKKQVSGLNATIRQLESEIASLQVVTADLTSELTKKSEELASARGSLSELQDTLQGMQSTEDLALATQVLARALQAKLVERAAEKGLNRWRSLLLLRSWVRWQVTTRFHLQLRTFSSFLAVRLTARFLRVWRKRALAQGRVRRVVTRSLSKRLTQGIAQATRDWREQTTRALMQAAAISRAQGRRQKRTCGAVLDALRGISHQALLLSKTHVGISVMTASRDSVNVRQCFHQWRRMVMRAGWNEKQCIKAMRISASCVLRDVWLEWCMQLQESKHQLLVVALEEERTKARECEQQARHQTGRLENVQHDAKILSSALLKDVEHQRDCLIVAAAMQEKSAEIMRDKSEEVDKLKMALQQRVHNPRTALNDPRGCVHDTAFRQDSSQRQGAMPEKRIRQEIVSKNRCER
jgi:hypothetical protein